ncbi:MAG: metal-dependent hydrolase [Candidatus Micrarchaeia archaeon]
MPNALAHVLGGAVVGVLLAATAAGSVEEKVLCGFIAIGASLLPDIDHPQGTARKTYRKIGLGAGAILSFVFLLSIGVSLPAAIFGGIIMGILLLGVSELLIPRHRGIIHSWKFALLLGIVVYAVLLLLNIKSAIVLAFAFFTGYISHLILDYAF